MVTSLVSARSIQTLVIVSVAYVAAQLLSDIASLKIVLVAGLSMDAGTLIYPLTFTLRDLVHKTGGHQTARLLIVCAAVINVVMAFVFQLTAALPGDPSVGDQSAFGLVLAPVWRIVIASIAAEVLSEFMDGEIYQRVRERLGSRRQWVRVLASNAVSVPIDSVVFAVLAFAGVLPPEVVIAIFVSNMLMKFALTLISLPAIYLVREQER